MKNSIIILLSILVITIPVTYLIHRHKKIRANAAHMQKLRALQRKEKEFRYEQSAGDSVDKGYILCTPSDKSSRFAYGNIVIFDLAGHMAYKKHFNCTISDFRQWRIGNRIYYSYMTDDSGAFHYPGFSLADGHIVILDSALNKVREVHLIPHDDINRDRKNDIDVHDLVMLSENHFITMINYEKKVNNIPAFLHPAHDQKVGACIIQEVVDDKVIWQWDATRFPEFYSTSIDRNHFGDTSAQDYCHFNAIVLDPKDSNLIVSFRGLNQIIKISRKTGEILWRLGGKNSDFPLADNQVFLGQHGIVFTDNNKTLLMLDNGDEHKRFYSRILEFRLDEKNKKVSTFSAYKIPHYFSTIQGNVSKVGQNYFIGGGYGKYMLLVDPKTDKYLFEMRINLPSYRAYLVDSLYGLEKAARGNP